MNEFILKNRERQGQRCFTSHARGMVLRNELEIALEKDGVIVDFDGIEIITQSFADEFLGPILAHEGQDILRVLKFHNCSEDVRTAILSTAHRFLSDSKAVS